MQTAVDVKDKSKHVQMLKINIKIISKANNSSLMLTKQMLEINIFRMEGPANMQKFSMHSSFKDNELEI